MSSTLTRRNRKNINVNKNKNKNKNKRRRITKKNRNLKCAPKSSTNAFSCYTNGQLFELKRDWNSRNKPILKSNNPKEIWNFLKDQYEGKCSKESCWVKNANIPDKRKKNLLRHTFAPKSPISWSNNPNTWLSSTDIIKVMNQYERAYPQFRFIGPSPIDFDKKMAFDQCVWNDLCNIDVSQLIKDNKTVIGIIFNLDPHYMDGSHWVSMYFNVERGEIYYFDSVGDKVPSQINNLRKGIETQCERLKIKTKFDQIYPVAEHQLRNTECGMYSLYFIIMMLTGKKKWKHFKSHNRIKDQEMEKFRKVFFNKDL